MIRNKDIDIMRAFCAIYIISFFHLNGYFKDEYLFAGNWVIISKMMTIISLGGFTFISGFCLSKYSFNNYRDVWIFYKRRLSRFYVLYFLAALTLYLTKFFIEKGWYLNDTQFLLSLVGLSSFYDPIPHTLWYFAMIMFFYFITPLLSFPNKSCRFLSFMSLLGGLVLYNHFFFVDNTLFLYFPFYFLGLLKPDFIFNLSKLMSIFLSCISIISLCVLYVAINSYELQLYLEYLVIPPGLILLISVARLFVLNRHVTAFFTFVSVASMVAYLFHRHVFGVACLVYSGDSSGPISPVVGLLASIVLFVSSYYIQVLYNRILIYIIPSKKL